jgi:hypothetical protein
MPFSSWVAWPTPNYRKRYVMTLTVMEGRRTVMPSSHSFRVARRDPTSSERRIICSRPSLTVASNAEQCSRRNL